MADLDKAKREHDVEKHAGDSCQNSTTLTSSSIHTDSDHDSDDHISEDGHDYQVDAGVYNVLTPVASAISQPPLTRKATSVQTTGTSDPSFEVDWEDENDPDNPKNWPTWYKAFVLFAVSFGTVAVVSYSTSYTSGLSEMMEEFSISSVPVATLGVTFYLFGLAIGSLILAPVSEVYGRKPVYVIAMLWYTLLVAPAAKATSLTSIIIVRFFGALGASAMISNAPGTVGDISVEKYQALAFSLWGIGPLNGPVIGPIIGGFSTQYLGWRWTDWIIMCMGAFSFIMLVVMKETYAPAILRRKASRLRKETDDHRWWCRYDQRLAFFELMKINLSRPLIMAVREQICIFWNVYIAIVYGILYLCFVAYPIVFAQRDFTTAQQGLAFIGIGIGTFMVIFLEPLIRKMINSHNKDPETGRVPPEAAMSIVTIGAILIPTGELWFAWTCLPSRIHWSIPIAAGIPFGAGNTSVFIYATNYLAHSYGIYAASALAGNSLIRSIMGGCLPLAGPTMYSSLNAHWAGTLLGILEVAIIPIPIIFYKYGSRIRKRSTLIRSMQEDKERAAKKRERGLARAAAAQKEIDDQEDEKIQTRIEEQGLPSSSTSSSSSSSAEKKNKKKKKMMMMEQSPIKQESQRPRHEVEIEAEKELDRLAGIRNDEEGDEKRKK
ncbi:putative mfs multidrug transporter [Phaeomoniella chlamydospora]|uniref:Putative mfs multidrug transporter n=1 Tax=Phaeomoniella chlamydospora TaxID=158046 RepID=A0A0G2EJP8_PHACM|nr:putative mfs multidrug transporter [Phaeomoniella chlamydospora]